MLMLVGGILLSLLQLLVYFCKTANELVLGLDLLVKFGLNVGLGQGEIFLHGGLLSDSGVELLGQTHSSLIVGPLEVSDGFVHLLSQSELLLLVVLLLEILHKSLRGLELLILLDQGSFFRFDLFVLGLNLRCLVSLDRLHLYLHLFKLFLLLNEKFDVLLKLGKLILKILALFQCFLVIDFEIPKLVFHILRLRLDPSVTWLIIELEVLPVVVMMLSLLVSHEFSLGLNLSGITRSH